MSKRLSIFGSWAVLATGLCLAGLTTSRVQAQTNQPDDWSWATELGPSSPYSFSGVPRSLYAVAADAASNVTVGGLFEPDLTFANDPTVLRTNRPFEPGTGLVYTNGFLAQYRPSGSLAWALNLDGIDAQVNELAADGAGNLYALGSYSRGQLRVGAGGPLLQGTGTNTFLAKVSQAGVVQWAVNITPATQGAYGWHLAVDGAGNSVVQGFFQTSITLGGQTYIGPGTVSHPFLARYTPAGVLASSWAGQQTQGSNSSRSYGGLALAGNGEVYLSGSVAGSGSLQFGTLPAVVPATTGGSGFLLQLSATNVAKWAVVGSSSYNSFSDVKVSPSGGIYLLGNSSGALTVGTQQLAMPGNDNTFIARLTPSGQLLRGSTGQGAIRDLTLGPHDDLYFATTNGPISWGSLQLTPVATGQLVSVVRLDSTGQALQGWRATGPGAIFRDPKLAVDGQGRAALGGWLYSTGTFNFGSHATVSAFPNGMFVGRTGSPVLASRAATPVAGLELYPNPARQAATVALALAAPAQAQLLDALGRVVSTQALPRNGRLDLNGLAPGPYLVRVQQGQTVSYRHLAILP